MTCGGSASVAAVLIVLLALPGCGSAVTQAEKQARIKAGLSRLEHELVAERHQPLDLAHVSHGQDVLGALTLFYEPAPRGVSEAEWHAALGRDTRIHQLEMEASATTTGGPAMIEVATPGAVTRAGAHELREYEAGKTAVAHSGCLACHRIGNSGNEGPGPDLTEVADRLPKQAIARTLVNPTAPMPSFKNLPRAKFHAIVAFLSQLK
jgi:mono/diheme cytochrome c family protein